MQNSAPPPLPGQQPSEVAADSSVAADGNRLLRQLLAIEALLAAIWIIAVCSFRGSGGTVAYWVFVTFVMVYPIHLVVTGIAIWARVKRKASTRLMTTVIVAPWVTLPVPFFLNQSNSDGPLLDSPQKVTNAIILLVGVVIVMMLFRPRKMASLLPACVLKSFGLNLLLLLLAVSLYLVPIGYLLFNRESLNVQRSAEVDGYLLAYGLGALAVYLAASSLPAALVLGYSSLSFFQDRFTRCRKLRVAQAIVSLPLVIAGACMLVAFWLQKR